MSSYYSDSSTAYFTPSKKIFNTDKKTSIVSAHFTSLQQSPVINLNSNSPLSATSPISQSPISLNSRKEGNTSTPPVSPFNLNVTISPKHHPLISDFNRNINIYRDDSFFYIDNLKKEEEKQ